MTDIESPVAALRPTATTRTLLPGEIFDDLTGPLGQGWRLAHGALRMDSQGAQALPAQLALAGDLLGAEGLAGRPCPYRVRALVPTLLQALEAPDSAAAGLQRLGQLLAQQWRRAVDMTRLRTGGVPERVQLLLRLLDIHEDGTTASSPGLALPRLRDMAAVVDSTPESVSRVITNLRRLHLLDGPAAPGQPPRAAIAAAGRLPAGMTSSRAGAVLTPRAACATRRGPR